MRKNHEGQVFWTGLPAEDAHEEVCAKGQDFIVFTLNGKIHAFEEHCAAATSRFLRDIDWSDWVRVRAIDKQHAIDNYPGAESQYNYWLCCGDDPKEKTVLNIVNIPYEDRPECPPRPAIQGRDDGSGGSGGE